jgi:hypothetical protein
MQNLKEIMKRRSEEISALGYPLTKLPEMDTNLSLADLLPLIEVVFAEECRNQQKEKSGYLKLKDFIDRYQKAESDEEKKLLEQERLGFDLSSFPPSQRIDFLNGLKQIVTYQTFSPSMCRFIEIALSTGDGEVQWLTNQKDEVTGFIVKYNNNIE